MSKLPTWPPRSSRKTMLVAPSSRGFKTTELSVSRTASTMFGLAISQDLKGRVAAALVDKPKVRCIVSRWLSNTSGSTTMRTSAICSCLSSINEMFVTPRAFGTRYTTRSLLAIASTMFGLVTVIVLNGRLTSSDLETPGVKINVSLVPGSSTTISWAHDFVTGPAKSAAMKMKVAHRDLVGMAVFPSIVRTAKLLK